MQLQWLVSLLLAMGGALLFYFPFATGLTSLVAWFCLLPVLVRSQRHCVGFAFLLGWVFGSAIWLLSVWWLSEAAMTMGGAQPLTAWVLVTCYCLYTGLPYGVLIAGYRWARAWASVSGNLAFVLLGSALLVLFPQPIPGNVVHAWHQDRLLLAWLSVGGVPLLLMWLLAVSAALASRIVGWRAWLTGLGLALVCYLGAYAIKPGQIHTQGFLNVLAIQPNLAPERGDQASHRLLQRVLQQTSQALKQHALATGERVDLVVWPELPIAVSFTDRPRDRQAIQHWVQQSQVPLLMNGYQRVGDSASTYWNQSWLIQPNGSAVSYTKQRLVPFGEYLPNGFGMLSTWLPDIKSYASADHGQVLTSGHGSLGVLVCYEALFVELSAAAVAQGALALINPGNDRWFRHPAAAHTHLALARFRAIEQRRALLRVFNAGVTTLLLPDGSQAPEIGQVHTAEQPVYRLPLVRDRSLYSYVQGWFPWLLGGLGLLAALHNLNQRRTSFDT